MTKKIVVLGLGGLSIPKKIALYRYVVTSMTGNTNFLTPSPALVTITANANALEAAHTAAMGGGIDDTALMHAKELMGDLALKSLGAYVEGLANLNPINAEAIIASAGMGVKAPAMHTASGFKVNATGNPGEIKMMTQSAPRATFIWQMTTDTANEAGWATISQNTRAKFVKTGLASGTRYYFRVSVVDKNGQGPWSNVLNIIAP